ncbi:TPA: phage tail protein I [Aeromonas dhakensis]|nr:phage tail protein I [Aeromonas dhakensis]
MLIPSVLRQSLELRTLSQLTTDELGALRQALPGLHVRDIDNCHPSFLPWLAWQWRVDVWDDAWPEAQKRAVVKDALLLFRYKGTAWAVKHALTLAGYSLDLVVWHEMLPLGRRGTFRVDVPATNTRQLGPSFYEQVFSLVERNKRGSQHWYLQPILPAIAGMFMPVIVNIAVKFGSIAHDGELPPPHAYPVANAGNDLTVTGGGSVTLDGSGSYDPAGDTLTYLWRQLSGPEVVLSSPSNAVTELLLSPPITTTVFQFELIVTNGAGLTGHDRVFVTNTLPHINQPPVARAGEDQFVTGPASIVLDGSASYDPEQGGLSYFWRQISGPQVEIKNPSSAAASIDLKGTTTQEVMIFELTVMDSEGATGVDSVSITNAPVIAELDYHFKADKKDISYYLASKSYGYGVLTSNANPLPGSEFQLQVSGNGLHPDQRAIWIKPTSSGQLISVSPTYLRVAGFKIPADPTSLWSGVKLTIRFINHPDALTISKNWSNLATSSNPEYGISVSSSQNSAIPALYEWWINAPFPEWEISLDRVQDPTKIFISTLIGDINE